MRVGQSDVAVWPDEIECPVLEAGSLHSRLPREAVERKRYRGTRARVLLKRPVLCD